MIPLDSLKSFVQNLQHIIIGNLRALPRKLRRTFWWTITTDKVMPFVYLYYGWLLLWGFYAIFFAAPITFIEPVMGMAIYNIWVWLHFIGPILALTGLRLEDKSTTGQAGFFGIYYQAGGHACMFLVLLAYEISAISVSYFGRGTYSIFVIAPYVMGCGLLLCQALAKIFLVEAIDKAIREGVLVDERNCRNGGD